MKKVSKLQSSHYRRVSRDPLGTICLSIGIHWTNFGNSALV